MTDYLSKNERANTSIVLLHGINGEDPGRSSGNIEFPITIYDAVVGAPDVIDSNNIPVNNIAPFNILVSGADIEMTESELNRFMQDNLNAWI